MREVENKRMTRPLGFGCVETEVNAQAIGQTQVDVKADPRFLHSLPEPSMDLETSTDSIHDIPPYSSMPSSGEKTLNPLEEADIPRSSQLAAKRLPLSDYEGNLTTIVPDTFWRPSGKGLTKPLPKRKRMFATSSSDKSDLNNFHDGEKPSFLHNTSNAHPQTQSIHNTLNSHPQTQWTFPQRSLARSILLINLATRCIVYVIIEIVFKEFVRTNTPVASGLATVRFSLWSEAITLIFASEASCVLQDVLPLIKKLRGVAPADQVQPIQGPHPIQGLQPVQGPHPIQGKQTDQATQATQTFQASTSESVVNAFLFVFFTWLIFLVVWYDSYVQQ
jgi:hypothetical protein